ncbi:MAG: bifunctional diaminohydroxyphosphoribosylaminopyrimidine deaminase/5-amino-6-(5-phosphoribosylamino)uracil reductase RibD [Aureisphaera sp.]
MTSAEHFMARCLQLAKKGLGTTYPNPLVGSVIVYKDRIIGEGWHKEAGTPHAEVHAIQSVTDPSLLRESTLYVSLEPCSHFGKTPPCADLIVEKRLKKVVIGCTDPNPKVAGRGIQKLRDAGCEVVQGVLEGSCIDTNKRFFTFHAKKRPYIILKWAQSSDGFLAPVDRNGQKPVWISNDYSKQLVHKMRSEEQAILVGTQTTIDDNPSLTTRTWAGSSPTRVVLDRNLRIPKGMKVFDQNVPTIVLNETKEGTDGLLFYEKIEFGKHVASQICEVLYKHSLQSVIIEGGARTLQTFIEVNLWDEAWIFKGSTVFGQGTPAPIGLEGSIVEEQNIKGDLLTIYKNNRL